MPWNERGTYGTYGDRRVIKGRPKFTRATAQTGTVVHEVTDIYLRWWTGNYPGSLEVTAGFACGDQRAHVRVLSDKAKVTCKRCVTWSARKKAGK